MFFLYIYEYHYSGKEKKKLNKTKQKTLCVVAATLGFNIEVNCLSFSHLIDDFLFGRACRLSSSFCSDARTICFISQSARMVLSELSAERGRCSKVSGKRVGLKMFDLIRAVIYALPCCGKEIQFVSEVSLHAYRLFHSHV